jgi:flagellar hook-associated protein 1
MANLFSALTMASRSLASQQAGLDVTGHNIANVNTPGYARRVIAFRAVPPTVIGAAGHGVDIAGIRAMRDRFVERRLDQETISAERESAIAELAGLAEVAFGTTGQSIDARLNAFFDSLAELSDAPTSVVARQEVALQGGALAAAFRGTANRLGELRREADRRITGTVDMVNDLAERIALLNAAFVTTNDDGVAQHMQDEQAHLVRELAGLIDITVTERPNGGLDIDVAGGRALVVGTVASQMNAVPTGPDGHVQIEIAGADLTSSISGGKIDGYLHVRDTLIPGYLQRLDEQAFTLAASVNAIHSAGFDLNGATGQAFFAYSAPPVGQAGAAAALIVDPAVAGDPNRIAAAQAALPGDNRAARALADLRNTPLLNGGTATLADAWGQLVFRVGRDVQTATDEAALRQDIVLQLQAVRDQISGVSLDEEAANLMKFQRAYEANARFFQVIDNTLDTLMNVVAR